MFSFIRRMRNQNLQLELYYPKNTYDRLARKEMKTILSHFNNLFYEAYPDMTSDKSNAIVDYYPSKHSRKYDVQRAIKLCKSQKVRRKDIVKIEEYLNLQYVIEEQLTYYHDEIKKAKQMKQLLSKEAFSSFFPELFEERMKILEKIKNHSHTTITRLQDEKQVCEKAINDLIYKNRDFWGNASRLIGNMVSDSVKHVVEIVDQSIRKKL